jgi:hypothetical protein
LASVGSVFSFISMKQGHRSVDRFKQLWAVRASWKLAAFGELAMLPFI